MTSRVPAFSKVVADAPTFEDWVGVCHKELTVSSKRVTKFEVGLHAEFGIKDSGEQKTYVKKGGKLHIAGYSNPPALLCERKGVGAFSRGGLLGSVTDWEDITFALALVNLTA